MGGGGEQGEGAFGHPLQMFRSGVLPVPCNAPSDSSPTCCGPQHRHCPYVTSACPLVLRFRAVSCE